MKSETGHWYDLLLVCSTFGVQHNNLCNHKTSCGWMLNPWNYKYLVTKSLLLLLIGELSLWSGDALLLMRRSSLETSRSGAEQVERKSFTQAWGTVYVLVCVVFLCVSKCIYIPLCCFLWSLLLTLLKKLPKKKRKTSGCLQMQGSEFIWNGGQPVSYSPQPPPQQ